MEASEGTWSRRENLADDQMELIPPASVVAEDVEDGGD
jgi:hypothetical protein